MLGVCSWSIIFLDPFARFGGVIGVGGGFAGPVCHGFEAVELVVGVRDGAVSEQTGSS